MEHFLNDGFWCLRIQWEYSSLSQACFRWGIWGSEKWSKLSKATWLTSERSMTTLGLLTPNLLSCAIPFAYLHASCVPECPRTKTTLLNKAHRLFTGPVYLSNLIFPESPFCAPNLIPDSVQCPMLSTSFFFFFSNPLTFKGPANNPLTSEGLS